MANYTKLGGIKIKAFNGLHDTEVNSSLPFTNYDTIKAVLETAKLAVRSCTERKFVPDDQKVQGNGTANAYKEGQIFVKRATKGTACIKALVPVEQTAINSLKAALATKKLGGEVPTSVTISYTAM